jgi:hypothetical protein
VLGANRYRQARRVCEDVHGNVPCVVASENSKTSPGAKAGFSTNSLHSCDGEN